MDYSEINEKVHPKTSKYLGWVMLLLTLMVITGARAQDAKEEINYLTSIQADSVMSVIGENKEIVLYCGHEDEAETYMVLCDYWKEPVKEEAKSTNTNKNSADDRFEIWVLGYDLHTGDTVCLPIAPSCIWFQKNDVVHNVGTCVSMELGKKYYPYIWKMPRYTLVSCLEHAGDAKATYHFGIHVYGYFVPSDGRPEPPLYYQRMKRASLDGIWNRFEQDDEMQQRQQLERQRQKEDERIIRQQQVDFSRQKKELEKAEKRLKDEQDMLLREYLKNF